VRNDFRAGLLRHRRIAAGMVAVLVRIQDLCHVPACVFGRAQAFLVIQGIDNERLSRFRARDQVIEVPIVVAGPHLFDDHDGFLCDEGAPAMIAG
jgi:hypothetical protein